MNPFRLDGRTVLITGGSSGIGRGIAECLASQGARLILVARNADKLEDVRHRLAGANHIVECVDLVSEASISTWFKERARDWGAIHGMVHCAGVMTMRPIRFMEPSDWEASLQLNVVVASALVKAFRQQVVRGTGGSVVFISSITGLVGQPAQSIYATTKGAQIAMARALSIELAVEKIRVNCIAPAIIDVGMSEQIKKNISAEQWHILELRHPLGLGRVEDVAHAALYLLAETGRWVTGTTLVVDGGYTAQ